MLEPLPSRNVARFMLPLADVMTVLFSLFLLLPALEKTAATAGDSRPTARAGEYWTPDEQKSVREELDRLRLLSRTPAEDRLYLVVMVIDPATGNLIHTEAGLSTTVATKAEADAFIGRHLKMAETEKRKLVFVLQVPPLPPGAKSPDHPDGPDELRYNLWFTDPRFSYRISGL